jgi:hypothetical protein
MDTTKQETMGRLEEQIKRLRRRVWVMAALCGVLVLSTLAGFVLAGFIHLQSEMTLHRVISELHSETDTKEVIRGEMENWRTTAFALVDDSNQLRTMLFGLGGGRTVVLVHGDRFYVDGKRIESPDDIVHYVREAGKGLVIVWGPTATTSAEHALVTTFKNYDLSVDTQLGVEHPR